ncbi:MAG: hypothetical protein A2583_06855 [Bdellovibrionales bacterium RIFOXYD1_FULL_53_11]|nr:MAG: hypothetical protein A2583_06855 [Bdellovibrionales bacterium RIFOXYD1_FULL_53_11]
MKKFVYDLILEAENICNLTEDRDRLLDIVSRGEKVVFSGRRNTGKTSLIKSVVIPRVKKSHPGMVVVFADFMGVANSEEIVGRMKKALELALTEKNPTKQFIQRLAAGLAYIRPVMGFDPVTGAPSVTLEMPAGRSNENVDAIFKEIGKIHKKHGALVVIDEFQDISFVGNAEALLRTGLQNLPAGLPIVLMGSKKHLLGRIFVPPDAPLAGWGRYVEISRISTQHYFEYIKERFKSNNLLIDYGGVEFLQKALQSIPESINIVCDKLLRSSGKGLHIKEQHIRHAIKNAVEERNSLYQERLSFFTGKEVVFLRALGFDEPVKQPSGNRFLSKIKMSTGSLGPLMKRLENQAVIYKTDEGYVVGDPLFGWFLRMSG